MGMFYWIVLGMVLNGPLGAGSEAVEVSNTSLPGAVIQPLGDTMVVDQVLAVKVNMSTITEVFKDIQKAWKTIDQQKRDVRLMEKVFKDLFVYEVAFENLEKCSELLERVLIAGGKSVNSRKTRSLFPVIGEALHGLFGTTTDGQLNEFRSNLEKTERWEKLNKKMILANSEAINMHARDINRLGVRVNTILEYFNISNQATMKREYLIVLNLHTVELKEKISQLVDTVEHVMRGIGNSAMGVLDPTLVSLSELKNLIQYAVKNFRFVPIYDDNELYLYYQLIETKLSINEMVIFIPFHSSHNIAFRVHKFPVTHKGKLVTADIDEEKIYLISKDTIHFAEVTNTLFSTCRAPMRNNFVCPANILTFVSTEQIRSSTTKCSIALMMQRNVEENCNYVMINLTDPFILVANGWRYLYFTRTIDFLNINCNNGNQKVITIKGPFMVPESCGISSNFIHVSQTSGREITTNYNPPNITFLKLDDFLTFQPKITKFVMDVATPKLQNMDSATIATKEYEQEWDQVSHLPIVSHVVLISTSGLIFLMVTICFFFAVCRKYGYLKSREDVTRTLNKVNRRLQEQEATNAGSTSPVDNVQPASSDQQTIEVAAA